MTVRMDRILKELEDMQINPPPMCSAGPILKSNLENWKAIIQGPQESPYANYEFDLEIKFPLRYPSLPPQVVFLTKMYHPNINQKTGVICLDLLKSGWKSDITLSRVLLAIQTLLYEPNPESYLEVNIATEMKNSRALFNKSVEVYCKTNARAI